MKCSKPGEFYGHTNETVYLDGIILNDADYLLQKVDWHYHENAYFTFLLEGGVVEGNKKETYECSAGHLLFHNWQDAHYNIASNLFTRGFHIEIEPTWFQRYDISTEISTGSINIPDPAMKLLMYSIFRETKLRLPARQLAIDALLIEAFDHLARDRQAAFSRIPQWVKRVKDALHAEPDSWQLTDLAKIADVHPVHLCRDFPRYFQSSLGEYIRKIKIEHALSLLSNKELSLTEIALQCNFSDQSHFIRTFKTYQQLTPLGYRKLLLNKCNVNPVLFKRGFKR